MGGFVNQLIKKFWPKCREIYWIRHLHTLVPFVINDGGLTLFNQVVGNNECCAALHVYTRGSPLALDSFLERIFP